MAHTPEPVTLSLIDEILMTWLRKDPQLMGATAEVEAPPRTKTTYQVFSVNVLESGPQLESLGEAQGLNDIEAIKVVTGQHGLDEGSYVAIPARSYRVRTISAEVTRRVSIK